jgi:hypothetical protein
MSPSNSKTFGSRMSASKKKVDNASLFFAEKVAIRKNVQTEIGVRESAVFDCFAGSGAMWRAVWRKSGSYTGCDLRWFPDDRRVYVADNCRVMRTLDLQGFNVFDFDSYGSPWEPIAIMAARRHVRKGERIGVVITEGSRLGLAFSQIPNALALMAGIGRGVSGAARRQDELIDKAIAGMCRRMRCKVMRRWQAEGTTGARMRYIGLVLKGEG